MSEEDERLQLALRIAIDALKEHLYCGDCYPEKGWPNVHQAFIDINLAREGNHPFQATDQKVDKP